MFTFCNCSLAWIVSFHHINNESSSECRRQRYLFQFGMICYNTGRWTQDSKSLSLHQNLEFPSPSASGFTFPGTIFCQLWSNKQTSLTATPISRLLGNTIRYMLFVSGTSHCNQIVPKLFWDLGEKSVFLWLCLFETKHVEKFDPSN